MKNEKKCEREARKKEKKTHTQASYARANRLRNLKIKTVHTAQTHFVKRITISQNEKERDGL